MFKRTVSPEDLARLAAEREQADRSYNDALTAVDKALPRLSGVPRTLPGPDESQLTAVNERWDILPSDFLAGVSGWRARLAGFVWRLVGPILQKQQTFNAAVVETLNRNLQKEAAIAEAWARLREHLEALESFRAHLVAYLQQVTPYLDTKDREVAGLMRRINEDVAEQCHLMEHRTAGLAAGLSGLGDEMLKRWDSLASRQERNDARVEALASEYGRRLEESQTRLSILQQASTALKREFEKLAREASAHRAGGGQAASTVEPDTLAPSPSASTTSRHSTAKPSHEFGADLDAYKYVGFEDRFRGTEEDIRERLAGYLEYFRGTSDVLDVGCGRGEFLELLREQGVTARGVDLNHEMVEMCRARSLDVVQADAVEHLETLPDNSLGGLFAAQVIEHLPPEALMRLLDLAQVKLKPGARIVLETINPACWAAFFESYILDLTHVRPVHPDTLKYLLHANNFWNVEILFKSPYPERAKLQAARMAASDASFELRRLSDLAEVMNANTQMLNARLFTYRDYAAIGVK